MKTTKRILSTFILLLSLVTILFSANVKTVDAVVNDYYASINNNLRGVQLKNNLRTLITNTHTYKTSYKDCTYPAKINGKSYVNPDQDPNNPDNIILFWSELSIPAVWDSGKSWNREHVWPKSHSWFYESGAGSDLHHLRPADPTVNSTHNNHPYGIVTNGNKVKISDLNGGGFTECLSGNEHFEPQDGKKGDVARIVFYLLTRYSEADSYTVNDSNVATSLDMLLDWNTLDPVDSSEIWRNDAVQGIQGNRNPFIDNQNYANMIWAPNEPIENGYNVMVDYDKQACSVDISGTRVGSGYKGNVTINVTMNEGYVFEGLVDKNNNNVVCGNLQYNINNISKNYNLKVKTSKLGGETPGPNPDPTPDPDPIDPSPITGNEFKKVNNISELKVGDKIILTGDTGSGIVAMSTNQKNNNRGETAVTNNGDIITKSNDTQVITLEAGNLPNTYAFKVDNGYLYAASSSNNYLRTQTNIDNNSSWEITFNNGVVSIIAQGNNNHNILRYNSVSNLFSCYTKGQKDITIYKEYTLFDQQIDLFQKENTRTSILINYSKDIETNEYTMANGGIRFGTCIDKTMFEAINAKGAVWGVEFFKGTGTDFSKAQKFNCTPSRVGSCGAIEEDPNGSYYQFALVLVNMHYKDIDTKVTARVFVTVGDNTYYMNPTTYTFREVVNAYLAMPDKSNFIDHIGILEHLRDFK